MLSFYITYPFEFFVLAKSVFVKGNDMCMKRALLFHALAIK